MTELVTIAIFSSLGFGIAWARKQVTLKNAKNEVCYNPGCYGLNLRKDARFRFYFRICQYCDRRLTFGKNPVYLVFGSRAGLIEKDCIYLEKDDFASTRYPLGLAGIVINKGYDSGELEKFLVYLQEYPGIVKNMNVRKLPGIRLPRLLENNLTAQFKKKIEVYTAP